MPRVAAVALDVTKVVDAYAKDARIDQGRALKTVNASCQSSGRSCAMHGFWLPLPGSTTARLKNTKHRSASRSRTTDQKRLVRGRAISKPEL
jgi:hypothetical protein